MTAKLLATTALATALALGGAPPAGAQTQQAPAAAQAQTQQQMQQFEQAERSLREAAQQMQGAQAGAAHNQAVATARAALGQMQQLLGQGGAQAQQGHADLAREVREAQQALQGDRPDVSRARAEIEQVLNNLGSFRAAMGGGGAAPGATAAQITVQEASPTIQVQQAQPLVTVQQPEPVITVIVPQPEIIVRQPAPEVTVQMPEPRVAVQMQQPQVRVVEAQPQVQVQQAQAQPQVQVERAQPRINVQQAEGQPTIRYEQVGQAQVTNQQQIQGQAQQFAQTQAQPQGVVQPGPQPGVDRAAVTTPQAGVALTRVSELVGRNVVGANGQNAGEVQNLLLDRNGQVRGAVVEWGGFLGLGTRVAVVPIEQIQLGANSGEPARLTLTREQLEALPRYDRNNINEVGSRYGWGDGLRLHR